MWLNQNCILKHDYRQDAQSRLLPRQSKQSDDFGQYCVFQKSNYPLITHLQVFSKMNTTEIFAKNYNSSTNWIHEVVFSRQRFLVLKICVKLMLIHNQIAMNPSNDFHSNLLRFHLYFKPFCDVICKLRLSNFLNILHGTVLQIDIVTNLQSQQIGIPLIG